MGGYSGGDCVQSYPCGREGTKETRQRQVVEAFPRVRTFLAEHPATGTRSYASARNELERLPCGRRTQVGVHTAARSGLPLQIVRGRRVVERVNAIVRASYLRDPGVLVAWRSSKWVRMTAGGPGFAPI